MNWTHIDKLRFRIVLVEGTRIGGSGGGLEIGGVDANLAVLRNPLNNEPYIPGSSLKGKLRSTLEKQLGRGSGGNPCGCGQRTCPICPIFGAHMNPKAESAPTRIVVRDAPFTEAYRAQWAEHLREGMPSVELKTENIINRQSGAAVNPRTGERVLPKTQFQGEIILHIYDGDKDEADMVKRIRNGLGIIEQASSLGASGSRGSGRVEFKEVTEERVQLAAMMV